MTRDAFDLSERFKIPVMVRLVTRLAHSRAVVRARQTGRRTPARRPGAAPRWILLPAMHASTGDNCCAGSRSSGVLGGLPRQPPSAEDEWRTSASSRPESRATTTREPRRAGLPAVAPAHRRVPAPIEQIRRLMGQVSRMLVLEEGYPFVERSCAAPCLRTRCTGKESGSLPPDGELTPDIVRRALGLRERRGIDVPGLSMPSRPPQLCAGCPHADSFDAIKQAIADVGRPSSRPTSGATRSARCRPLRRPVVRVHGRVDWDGEGGVGRGTEADDRGHRRQHLPALRRDAAHGRGRCEHGYDARHPGQRDDGHDGRAADHPAAVANRVARARPGRGPGALPRCHGSPPPHRAEPRGDPPRGRISRLSVIIAVRECIETLKAKKDAVADGGRPSAGR